MRILAAAFFSFLFFLPALCQKATQDTLPASGNYHVTVRAFEQHKAIGEVAAAINYVSNYDINRFHNGSLVPAINATAGVRMEERSPGSYRLNIRGSSLRSPFGVRNVKVYYNHIPFTDPGGQTYLNQLGMYNAQSLEIIKGPGSSLYGSGTGGVMLISNSFLPARAGVTVAHTLGSYGMHNTYVNAATGDDRRGSMLSYQHQQSNGYRQHSALRRDVLSWEGFAAIAGKGKLSGSFFYSDLYYQTPGALTAHEYQSDPRMARPGAGMIPGAVLAGAAVYSKTFLAGINYAHRHNDHWNSEVSLYGVFTNLENAAIRNYAKSFEPHTGGRGVITYKKDLRKGGMQWYIGGEVQQGFSTINTLDNKQGNPDTLRLSDQLRNLSFFLFSQLNYTYNRWSITGGVSYNRQHTRLEHLFPSPYNVSDVKFNNHLAPRLAVLYKLNDDKSFYTSVSRGFSPPTTAEIYPTGSFANPGLQAEEGWNMDIGFKGKLFSPRLFADINVFDFRLQNAIVQRRDVAGGDYFVNAGNTRQRGLEMQAWYQLFLNNPVFAFGRLWMNYSYYHFRYKNFVQVNNDYAGKNLPGIAPHTIGAGADVQMHNGFYAHLTYQMIDRMPLNDANTAFTAVVHLLATRVGYKANLERWNVDIFAGIDNLLNQQYSLGNDINGFGGRYFNAAAPRNYFAGLSIQWKKPGKKKELE